MHQTVCQNTNKVWLEIKVDLADKKFPIILTKEYPLTIYATIVNVII
jgi:hypothetical protein